jgi:hypothetical protein
MNTLRITCCRMTKGEPEYWSLRETSKSQQSQGHLLITERLLGRSKLTAQTLCRYYGTAAMGALFRYLFENGESFAPHSLRIEYRALEGGSSLMKATREVGHDVVDVLIRHHAHRSGYGEQP